MLWATYSIFPVLGTGCALPQGPPSRFGILRARIWSRSLDMRWTTLEIDSGLKWWLISLSDGIYPPTIMTTISYYWPNNLIFKRTSQRERSIHNLSYQVPGSARADPPQCLSLAWSADGQTLFAGYSDNLIRVWQVHKYFPRSHLTIFSFMPNPYALAHGRKLFINLSQVSVAGTR